MNARMREILGDHADQPEPLAGPLPAEAAAELAEGLEEVSGCALPHDPHRPGPLKIDRDNGEDETYVECQISKWNFIDVTRAFHAQLPLGLSYAFALRAALEASHLKGPFRVILSADPEPPYPSVTVRYRRVRADQPWLGDDLEVYRQGVLAIDFCQGWGA